MATRASNGESTIYKGADGRWHGYVSVGFKLDGKLDRRHVSSKSRGVVVARVRELERQRDTGTVSETSTPTVAWWLEHWLTPSRRAGYASERWRATSPPSAST